MEQHEELLELAGDLVVEQLGKWRKNQGLEPFALTWPQEPVESDDGKLVYGGVICQLKDVPQDEWTAALRQMVTVTKAFGLLLVERQGEQIRAVFESHKGARAWLTPLHRHGDRLALGETAVHDNTECIGILWRPVRGAA